MDGSDRASGKRESEIVSGRPLSAMGNQTEPGHRGRARVLRMLFTAFLGFFGGFLIFTNQIVHEQAPFFEHSDGMVVLTGGADRVSDAIRLLRDGYARRLLITGVRPGTSALEIARRAAESASLLECCVDLGYAAQNTAGNAIEAARWARDHDIRGSIIVVTSSYHMPRALVEMRRRLKGFDLIPYPVVPERIRDQMWWSDSELFRLVATEYVKYIYARARILAASLLAD